MLRIRDCKSSGAAQKYYTAHSQSDYYMKDQVLPAFWSGTLAEYFGLSGEVKQADFNRLCEGRDPRTGRALLPDKRKTVERRSGQDWTFSAPKSLTLLWEWTGDKAILNAFRESVQETMDEAEAEMKTRVRKGRANVDRDTGNFVWAGWTHTTTRPINGVPDCHLHTHVFVMNMTLDKKEGRIKAGQFGDLKRDGPYWDAAFESRLAGKLNALGYATEKDGQSFKIAGVERSVSDKFSRRTKEINAKIAAMEAEGITLSAAEKDRIGEKTRKKKTAVKEMTKAELKQEWWSRLTPDESKQLRQVANHTGRGSVGVSAKEAMEYAVAHCFQNDSTLPEKRLKEAALRYGVGSVSVAEVDAMTKMDGVYTRKHDGQLMATTRKVLSEEMAILRMAREGNGRYSPMAQNEKVSLEGEQLEAARHILKSRDFVIGIRGGAGTGKTTMMRPVIGELDRRNIKVQLLTPDGENAEKLRKDGFGNTVTVARLLVDANMQQSVAGSLLWVDEAGKLGSQDMHKLLTVAEAHKCRVVLSGDYRQHGSVGRGNATLRLMETDGGVRFAELRKIRRQVVPTYREAVETLQGGEMKRGFDQLDKAGCVVRAKGRHRHKALVKEYLQAIDEGKSVLVIAPTHREGQSVNAKLREELKKRGVISYAERSMTALDSTQWTDAQRGDVRNYEAGQVVQFMQNVKGFKRGEKVTVVESEIRLAFDKSDSHKQPLDKVLVERDGVRSELPLHAAARFQVYQPREVKLAQGDTIRITQGGIVNGNKRAAGAPRERINNGASYTIKGFTPSGDIRLDNGWILPKDYGHLRHGLVDTSFGAQGKTVDRVLIAMGNNALGAIDRAQFYVSVSRGREAVRIFLENTDAVKRAIEKDPMKMSAVELMRGRGFERITIERNRLGRYLKEKAVEMVRAVREKLQPERSLGYGAA